MLLGHSQGGNQAPSSITPAPGTLWSSRKGSCSLGCDESSGFSPAGACACSSGGIWGPILPPGTCWGLPVPGECGLFPWESWVCALCRWRGMSPGTDVAPAGPGGSGSFWRGFNLLWDCCRWHGRKERRNTACQGRVPYFKLLPLPGNKYASLQNNNYEAWEKIQGAQKPSVGVGVLADAWLGVFGGNVIPAGHG